MREGRRLRRNVIDPAAGLEKDECAVPAAGPAPHPAERRGGEILAQRIGNETRPLVEWGWALVVEEHRLRRPVVDGQYLAPLRSRKAKRRSEDRLRFRLAPGNLTDQVDADPWLAGLDVEGETAAKR